MADLDNPSIYTYTPTNNNDSFNLCVGLEAGAGDEDVNSQIKCGAINTGVCNLGIGVTVDKIFVVCAN